VRSLGLVAASLAGTFVASVACTTLTDADSFFDPNGTAVLAASFPDGEPTNLVLHDGALFASVGRRLFRIPKEGGAPEVLRTLASEPRALGPGAPGTIFVCARDEGPLLIATSPPFGELPLFATQASRRCLGGVVAGPRVIYMPENPVDPASEEMIVTFNSVEGGQERSARTPFQLAPSDLGAAPVATSVGTASAFVVSGVAAHATDTVDICFVGRSDRPRLRPPKVAGVLAAVTSQPLFVTRGTADALRFFGLGGVCCRANSLESCGTKPAPVAVDSPNDFALTPRYLYWLTDGYVARRALDPNTLSTAASEERFAVSGGGSRLVVESDETRAWIVQGQRIVRLDLR